MGCDGSRHCMIEEFDFGGEDAKAVLPHLHTLRERIHEDV